MNTGKVFEGEIKDSIQKHNEFLQKNVGREYFVTVEKKTDRKTGLYKAVTPNYIKVMFEGAPEYKNKFVKIRLKKADAENEIIFAEIVK